MPTMQDQNRESDLRHIQAVPPAGRRPRNTTRAGGGQHGSGGNPAKAEQAGGKTPRLLRALQVFVAGAVLAVFFIWALSAASHAQLGVSSPQVW